VVDPVAAVEKVNLEEKLAKFQDLWNPKIVGQVNDFHVKLVKVKGEFVWHHHDNEDELFLVVRGRMTVQLPQGDVEVGAGELLVVPRGMEHRPVAREETHVLLLERASTVNTGNVQEARTRTELERI
jgi:mannose-6-phosphate isomerase-like protein (cupin superfamily)